MISINRLTELMRYNPETGCIYRSIRGNWSLVGSPTSHGYQSVMIDRKNYYLHRIAVALMLGEWPEQVDHIDGNRSNNKWSNLRVCDNARNNQNKYKPHGSSVYKGVYYYSKLRKWHAQIRCG